jgi:ribosomal protein S12
MNNIKNKILGAVKNKEYIEKGEATCRNIRAVQDIFSNNKLSIEKKIDLINRYIPGIKAKVSEGDNFGLMDEKNKWMDVEIKICKGFMDSVGANSPEKIKKFVKSLLKLDEIKVVKQKQNSPPVSPKLNRRRSSSVGDISGVRYSIMVASTLSVASHLSRNEK